MSEDIEDVDLVDELDEDLDEDLEVGDGEDLEDEDADDDPDEEPPQPTRGQNRVAAATRKAAEAQERADRLERELQDLRTRPAQPTQPQETREQFNARLANMDPVEREAYLARLDAQSARSDTQALRFEMANQTDKIGFDSLCARNPAANKLADEVERKREEYLRQGTVVPRLDVLKHILGERALANTGRAKGKAERSAAVRRDQQASRPTSGRGDAPREGRTGNDSPAARYKRIENLKI